METFVVRGDDSEHGNVFCTITLINISTSTRKFRECKFAFYFPSPPCIRLPFRSAYDYYFAEIFEKENTGKTSPKEAEKLAPYIDFIYPDARSGLFRGKSPNKSLYENGGDGKFSSFGRFIFSDSENFAVKYGFL